MTRRHALTLGAGASIFPWAARANYSEPYYLDGHGTAIRGYDPVAYFHQDSALRGSAEFETRWDRVLWRFSAEPNLTLFNASPQKYVPQYGGYCAEGAARGFKRTSDPKVWVIVNGKLYLHYAIAEQNRWAGDIIGNIRAADRNWLNLRDL